ncbi:TadE family type IV pilus minor pilin [Kutzneria sp. NPDC052558]|uniref:TadE family type IV pilus minor pilin n=1 Tax=Kutzneria sp. NPDC052558 TaxID=3364121 RepID=UPI0037C6949B
MAIALSGVVFMLALCLSAIGAVIATMQATDAAAAAARLAARGDRARADEAATQLAPHGAEVSIKIDGDEVTTTVTAPPLPLLLGLRPAGTAYAVLEPGALTE